MCKKVLVNRENSKVFLVVNTSGTDRNTFLYRTEYEHRVCEEFADTRYNAEKKEKQHGGQYTRDSS